MFSENLAALRKEKALTQESLAERVGVTRQAVAKWEAGESVPDLDKCRLLAEALGVSLDALANYELDGRFCRGVPPKGKHLFGVVTVGADGSFTLPAEACRVFAIAPGDKVVVLGDEAQGIALMKADGFLRFADAIRERM